ncbi:DUF317 domain-containing protein [Streptomyces sp. NPDC001093]|uniref:DUF317 domain-containing protein n=1 Tax=Streptomyces sp. NPDC001093 TaxID=3154376 RepID=UPI0033187F3D
MPLSERQLAAFSDKHAWQIPFDTTPRHLAGPGDARHVTHGLAAAGWTHTSDPLSPEIVLHSPDHRHTLRFDPQSATWAWWRLRAEPTGTEPGWYAEFGELVPAEIIGHLADALIGPVPVDQTDVLQVLREASWATGEQGTAHSPDGMCRLKPRYLDGHAAPSWRVETREHGHGGYDGPLIWYASFDSHTPSHLVNAFVTALADPTPLQRAMGDRTAHYTAVKSPSPLRPEQIVKAHTDRLKTIRATVRASHRQNSKPSTSPATPTAARPAARR